MGFGDKFDKNCTHQLVFDYGYMKQICYRQHTHTEKEKASYRNLRCIQCGKDLRAEKGNEMFERTEGIIASNDKFTYSELFDFYEQESKNYEEQECIESVKKKVYKM